MTSGGSAYAAAVRGWADHLRAGGTTPWATWVRDLPATTASVSSGPLPDAVHLELLRRLNERAGASLGDAAADVVLGTPSPGRGLVDVPLPWPGHEPTFGSPAIDPARLPSEELVRLAAGVLTRLLPGVPPGAEASAAPDRWPLPWRSRFRVHGAPLTADVVRRGLTAAGAVESDWRPVHLVVARPVEELVAEHWTAATRAGSILRWSAVWRRARAADHLPGPVDVAAIADRLHRQGADVHVLVSPDTATATRLAARLLGVRPPPAPAPAPVDLPGSDLLRRVNRLAALGEAPRTTTQRLVQVLDAVPRPVAAPAPRAPRASRDWAARAAARLAEDLSRADYPVLGDLAALHPASSAAPRGAGAGTIDPDHTLEVALAACLTTLLERTGPT